MTKLEIIQKLDEGFSIVGKTLSDTSEDIFHRRKDERWSVAENTEHLILSVKPLNKAFALPNFVLLFFGKLNRPQKGYEEIVTLYHQKLAEGAVATPQFIPRESTAHKEKIQLTEDFEKTNQEFIKRIQSFSEEDLDKYLLPHPVLGKLTIREMLYFTIYHTLHHHKAIIFQKQS